MTYRPLPDFLEIRRSEVDGLGLFTNKTIPKGTELGITHVRDGRFQNGYIRTPLGGFFNHSEEPNCEASIKEVEKDKELTAYYWLYNLGEKNEFR